MKKRELVVASCTPETVKVNFSEMPAHEQDLFARTLIRSVTEAFKNPQVAAEYEQWKAARHKK